MFSFEAGPTSHAFVVQQSLASQRTTLCPHLAVGRALNLAG